MTEQLCRAWVLVSFVSGPQIKYHCALPEDHTGNHLAENGDRLVWNQ